MIKRPTISQRTVNRMFPVTDELCDAWWNAHRSVSREDEIIIRCAIRYQAEIEYSAQEADHAQVHALVRRARVFYRRAKLQNESVLAVFQGR